MSNEKGIEIGEEKRVVLDQLYTIHRRGDPFEEGREISRLIGTKVVLETDNGPKEVTLTQDHFADMLNLSQAEVFRLVSLTTLEPRFEEMYHQDLIAKTTAYELATLSPDERSSFLKRDKVTYKEVNQFKRDLKLKPLLELAAQPFPGETQTPQIDLQQADAWWNSLAADKKIDLYKARERIWEQ